MNHNFISDVRLKHLKGKRILVTGAAGFIGSHLVERLVLAGSRVTAFIRYTSSQQIGWLDELDAVMLAKIDIIHGDLRDSDAVDRAMIGMQMVYHLGALIGIPYSYVHPVETVDTNVMGTLNVLMAAKRHSVERIIHVSTSEVYGTPHTIPIRESHPLQGQSPYAASKIAADKLVESFYLSYNMPVVTIRPFNTYGPRQSDRAVIPTIISQALESKSVTLGNLASRRDFMYVDDTVQALLLAGVKQKIEGNVFHLGTGSEIRMSQLVELVGELLGFRLHLISASARKRPKKSEVARLVSDPTLASQKLGWIPQWTLREGLKCTIQWVSEHRDYYRPHTYRI